MLERLLLALLIIAIGVLAWHAWNHYSLKRVAAQTPTDPALETAARGTPTILYFTTPFCVTCRTQQQPALQQITAAYGSAVQIIQIDAAADTEAADRWGVFSAPTTFVLDERMQPRFVNRGVATSEILADQLGALGKAMS